MNVLAKIMLPGVETVNGYLLQNTKFGWIVSGDEEGSSAALPVDIPEVLPPEEETDGPSSDTRRRSPCLVNTHDSRPKPWLHLLVQARESLTSG